MRSSDAAIDLERVKQCFLDELDAEIERTEDQLLAARAAQVQQRMAVVIWRDAQAGQRVALAEAKLANAERTIAECEAELPLLRRGRALLADLRP